MQMAGGGDNRPGGPGDEERPERTAGAESRKKGAREAGFFKGMSMLASMGIAMVVATFFGLIIGIYLDRYFSTKPWLTLIFLVFGIAAGFKNVFYLVRIYGDRDNKDQR